MGYNLSRRVCERNKRLLEKMLEKKATFKIPAENPKKKAFAIREALEAVHHNDGYAELYGELDKLYRINTLVNCVEIEYLIVNNKPTPESEIKKGETVTATAQEKIQIVVENLETPKGEIHLVEVRDILAIIGSVIKLGDKADELFFPDAYLDDDEKLKLYNWVKNKGWKFIDHLDAGITLTKKEINEFVLWEPTDIQKEG